jgi:pimeloyl-ACP methyl ester carboxylesterase
MSNINHKIYNQRHLNQKPLLVFLHEGLGSIEQWKDFPEKVSIKTNLPVLVYDRAGHGKSSPLEKPRTADYMHEAAYQELPELLKSLKISSKLILVGHSDGATIALLFASKFPQKVLGLISIAAHAFVEEISLKGIKKAVEIFENGNLKTALEKYHGSQTHSMFYSWANTWLSDSFSKWNILEDIKDVTCPSLVIQGDNDQYGTQKQVDEIVKAIGNNATPMIVDNCGHAPHLEKEDFLINEIRSFVKEITKI